MKRLIVTTVLPLSVISFAIFTKWWYALPVDAPDTLFFGLPFPFVCSGWHTSMSLQIFILPFFADFLVYLLFWMILLLSINRFLAKLKPHRLITIGLWTISLFLLIAEGLLAANSNNLFYIKRPYEIKIMETGYKFVWERTEYPDYYKYNPKK